MLPKPNDGFAWVQAAAGPALVCAALEPYALHLFTTRSWALGNPDADRDTGWAEVARALRVAPGQLVRAHQVHGRTVIVCKRGGKPASAEPLPSADIIVTDDPAIAIAIQTADCVPMLLADPRTGAVAAAHAGWRGLAARVPETAIEALASHFDSRPDDLIAAIGPSISGARYEIDAPVRAAFERGGFDAAQLAAWFSNATAGHWQFDGLTSARDQLVAAGIAEQRVYAAGLCTAGNDVMCSYRRDATRSGRLAAAIRRRL